MITATIPHVLQASPSLDLAPEPDTGRSLGILVLSPSMHLIYMNWTARDLCYRVNNGRTGRRMNGVLPIEVVELCQEVGTLMRTQTDPKDWEQVRVRHQAGSVKDPVQIMGFAIPDPEGTDQSRIFVILEHLAEQSGAALRQSRAHFKFTPREAATLQYLMKGWTNKEIANELGVSEHTVKAHLKHIMQKTKSTTRTEVLAHVHACSSEHVS
jgi:DNA-binding CsgD family transcriptional regulator